MSTTVLDANCRIDFEAFCETTGHHLVECREDDDLFTIVIRIAG